MLIIYEWLVFAAGTIGRKIFSLWFLNFSSEFLFGLGLNDYFNFGTNSSPFPTLFWFMNFEIFWQSYPQFLKTLNFNCEKLIKKTIVDSGNIKNFEISFHCNISISLRTFFNQKLRKIILNFILNFRLFFKLQKATLCLFTQHSTLRNLIHVFKGFLNQRK